MVERPSWSARNGREAIFESREWSGGPPGGTGVVEKPSRIAGSGREYLLKGREDLSVSREGSGGPPRGPGVVRNPS